MMLTADTTSPNRQTAHDAAPFRTLFVADWVDAVFVHYAFPPAALQPHVPFALDTFDGVAFVSLVAFTQRRLRPAVGGRIAEALSTPLARHEFLNVRTYVRNAGERGIHFLAEWIPNRLAALIGPPMYGLPYRVGRLRYAHDPGRGKASGVVAAPGGRVEFDGRWDASREMDTAQAGSVDDFLVERYTAWTYRHGVARRFRIRHAPWQQARADVTLSRDDLLAGACGAMLVGARPVLAHVSPGTRDVRMGPPARCAVETFTEVR